MSSPTEPADNSLARDMGPLGAVATVVAGTLGAGLFVTLGTASSTTGPSVILVVAFSGLLAMAIATNYSWMATIFPGAAGSYTYISRTFRSRLPGFVVTWSKWLGYMAADAVLAIGFGSYLKVFYPNTTLPFGIDFTVGVGFALLTALFLVNLVGTKGYSVSQNVIFGLLVLSILVLVVPGLFSIDTANYRPFFTGGFDGFVAAAVPLFYAYIGIAVAGQMGAEVRNPGRNLPLAMVGGTAILITLYMLTAAVIYGIVGDYTVLANSERPLATAAEAFLGDIGVAIVAIGGLLATASSVHAVMAAGIKMPYSWSWDEVFPKQFSAVNDRFRTPHWSLLALYLVASALTFWSGGLDKALAIATFSYLIAYLTVSLTAGYVYVKRADIARRAAFQPGSWFYLSVGVAVLGSAGLLTQAANWLGVLSVDWGSVVGALGSGDVLAAGAMVNGAVPTLSIYVPWLLVGLGIFEVYRRRGEAYGTDVSAILDTLPGVPSDEWNPDIREDRDVTDDTTPAPGAGD
ncbi:APC family permease [Halomarina litorea]|uniref:APC family permease n=1 Tax=Halomarina litorea TaxID=2961595 RepID=UPI0020C2250B|nr:APC family permease [Halomarina sp. BCD28]